MRSIISGHVDHTVVLGQAGYGDALTITQSGMVVPAYSKLPQAGANGIDIAAGVLNAKILNEGTVVGGKGSYAGGPGGYAYGYAGGVGIDFSAAGRLANQGSITGGAGGSASYTGGDGGIGVHFGRERGVRQFGAGGRGRSGRRLQWPGRQWWHRRLGR